jgi:hypothetical protein
MPGRNKNPQVRSRFPAMLSFRRPVLHWTLAALLLADVTGCTRRFFRKECDKEVSEVLANKDKYPQWKIENWWVYPHPLARFADPTNPDRPPKPPDDPAAYDLSPNPQHVPHAGVERIEGTGYLELIAEWDRENREKQKRDEADEKKESAQPAGGTEEEEATENAASGTSNGQSAADSMAGPVSPRDAILEATERSSLDVTDRPAYLLTLDQAAELAMFNSREYQDRRENLYLAALPVTLERFSFAAQFLAAQETIRQYSGRGTPMGHHNNWTLNNGIGVSKILPTGALLLLNFSNQTVAEFIKPKSFTSVSTLDFTAIQPLLRGGGKAVTLEPLTLAERNLLYEIRSYARFRKELYVLIASNGGGSISGGSFQPVGVLSGTSIGGGGFSSSSGVVPGVIHHVATTLGAPPSPPTTSGSIQITGAITPPPSGYLNTMLQNIQVYIDKENIDVLTAILRRYRGLLEGDIVAPLQVQSVEQQLLAGRATLLTDQDQYLASLNAFKLEIGVPMSLKIEMDDSVLRPLMKQFRRSRAIIEDEQAAVTEASNLIAPEQAPRLRAELRRLFQTSTLVKGTPFARTIGGRWAAWEKLSDKELKQRLEDLRKEAQALLDRQASLQAKDQALSEAELARLKQIGAESDLGNFERVLRLYEANYIEDGKPKKLNAAAERRRITDFRDVIAFWQKVLVEARDDRWAAVRKTWPDLPRACVDGVDLVKDDLLRSEAAAAQHALINRLDLMNVRAQVVDAWRQIAVFANALLGTFNVEYHLSSNTPLGQAKPLDIGGSRTTHQLIVDTDLPLVRKLERNSYRASLIGFQRQRRALQEAEDLAVEAVQNEMYLLRQYAETYKIQQRQLELAYLTIDSSLEALLAPTPPGAARAGQDGPAALTSQLLSAQSSLPRAQNGLLTVWINYLNARLQLYRDLELMPLDQRGVWIDEIRDCDCGTDSKQSSGTGQPSDANGQRVPERLPELVPPPKAKGLE